MYRCETIYTHTMQKITSYINDVRRITRPNFGVDPARVILFKLDICNAKLML